MYLHETFAHEPPNTLSPSAGIQYMGATNRVGIGLSERPARLHWLAESISWNRFLGSLKA